MLLDQFGKSYQAFLAVLGCRLCPVPPLESTSGGTNGALDVAHVQQFSKLLRQIVDRTGSTVMFASHDLNWAAAYSDRVMVMRDGALAADLTPAEIMRREIVRDLFGFDAQTVSSGGRTWIVPEV